MTMRHLGWLGMTVALAGACAPMSTPSMMSENKIQLVHETAIEQIPVQEIDDVTLTLLADDYRRYGKGPMELAMVYDPRSTNYTAMKARNQLNNIEKNLKARGVHHVNIRTMPVEEGQPALLVSYESFQAAAPKDCHTMPGVDGYQTTRDIAHYRFGCSTESLVARQIARPADLMGRAGDTTPSDGRRATNIVEEYRNYGPGDANEQLESFGADDIGG